jgi:hypothetical protein
MNTSDVVEIHQVLGLYGHGADAADPQLLGEVFASDALFDADPVGGGRHEGLDAIVTWFAEGKPPHPAYHIATNFHVYEDGGQVRSRSKWMIAYPEHEAPMSGDYADVWTRTEHGWRIAERVATGRLLDSSLWISDDS